jgi:serine O-acetyltransferase
MDIKFAEEILKIRHNRSAVFPAKQKIYRFIEDLIDLLFPHYSGEYEYFVAEEVLGKLMLLKRDLKKLLLPQQGNIPHPVDKVADKFFKELPTIYNKLWLDAQAIYEGDPAAESIDEVISAYPGFLAIYTYRIAHEFYLCKVPIFPRMLTEYAHYRTGIDIHAGARIGDSFFIDHGTGDRRDNNYRRSGENLSRRITGSPECFQITLEAKTTPDN